MGLMDEWHYYICAACETLGRKVLKTKLSQAAIDNGVQLRCSYCGGGLGRGPVLAV